MSDNMGDDITVCPEQLVTSPTQEASSSSIHIEIPEEAPASEIEPTEEAAVTEVKGECRFCQEEDCVCKLETPCACNGTIKNYAVTQPRSNAHTAIDMNDDGWRIPGTNTQIRSPLNEECNWRNPTRGVIFGITLVLFLAVLILRDVYYYTTTPKQEAEDNRTKTLFCVMTIILAPFSFVMPL